MFVNTFNLILKYMSSIDDNHHLSLRLPGAGRAGNVHGHTCCRAEMEGKMADHRSANTELGTKKPTPVYLQKLQNIRSEFLVACLTTLVLTPKPHTSMTKKER
jgi:hypothetical protein